MTCRGSRWQILCLWAGEDGVAEGEVSRIPEAVPFPWPALSRLSVGTQ